MMTRLRFFPLLLATALLGGCYRQDSENDSDSHTDPVPTDEVGTETTDTDTDTDAPRTEPESTGAPQATDTEECPPVDERLVARNYQYAEWSGEDVYAFVTSYRYTESCSERCRTDYLLELVRIGPEFTVTPVATLPSEDYEPVDISGDGSVFAVEQDDMVSIRNHAGDVLQEYSDHVYSDIVLSHDGSRALLMGFGTRVWYLTDIPWEEPAEMDLLTEHRASPHIAWSPDDTRIAYVNFINDTAPSLDHDLPPMPLVILDLTDMSYFEISTNHPSYPYPIWSADGQKVLFIDEEPLTEEEAATMAEADIRDYTYKVEAVEGAVPELLWDRNYWGISPDGARSLSVEVDLIITDIEANTLLFRDGGGGTCG